MNETVRVILSKKLITLFPISFFTHMCVYMYALETSNIRKAIKIKKLLQKYKEPIGQ